MFSVIFPGQGSQLVGMGKDLLEKYSLVKDLFQEADDALKFPLTKLVLDGPKEELNLTENTQPAIFLISYSIFKLIKDEFKIDLNKANFFAGHSLGEYSALTAAGSLSFSETLKILKIRGNAMQNSVPKGEGGMFAILGSEVRIIEDIINNIINNIGNVKKIIILDEYAKGIDSGHIKVVIEGKNLNTSYLDNISHKIEKKIKRKITIYINKNIDDKTQLVIFENK